MTPKKESFQQEMDKCQLFCSAQANGFIVARDTTLDCQLSLLCH